jgi:hypothetical protein
MKISARNIVKGKVVSVTGVATTAHVKIDVGARPCRRVDHQRSRRGSRRRGGRDGLRGHQGVGRDAREGVTTPARGCETARRFLGLPVLPRPAVSYPSKWRTLVSRSAPGRPSMVAAQPTISGRRPNSTTTRPSRAGPGFMPPSTV